jgi:hypothetical protein
LATVYRVTTQAALRLGQCGSQLCASGF